MKLITIVFICAITLILVGCNALQKVSGTEFQKEYDMRNMQTMHYAEYLGNKDGKVYLLKKSMAIWNPKKWTEEIIYTNISELNQTFKKQLLSDNKELDINKLKN